jgi:hypothetical protein
VAPQTTTKLFSEDQKVEESDYIKNWRLIPKSNRDRLSKKQIARIDKPDLLTEALKIEFVEDKHHGREKVS